MDALEHMRPDATHEPVALAHRITAGLLEVTLPSWAAPAAPMTAPPTSFHSYFLPVERRDSAYFEAGSAGARS